MNITKRINSILIAITLAIFIYILFILISSVGHGFDITDNSYYILAMQHQSEIYSTVRHDGYYNGLLLWLANGSLAYTQLYGILVLIIVAFLFASELYKYTLYKFQEDYNTKEFFIFIFPIVISSLAYYRSFLLTPSYNWLALIGTLLVVTFSLRIVTRKNINFDKWLTIDYLLLSFAFNVAFMAKPSTAVVLLFISIIYIIYERKNINIKKVLSSVILLTLLIVGLQIIYLDGGFELYLTRLLEDMQRLSLVNNMTILERLKSMIFTLNSYIFEKFYISQKHHLWYVVLVLMIFLYTIKTKKFEFNKNLFVLIIGVYLVLFLRYFQNHLGLIWLYYIEILFVIIFLLNILFFNTKIKLSSLFIIVILVNLYSFAYYFGTTNNVVRHMASSIVYVVASLVFILHRFSRLTHSNYLLVLFNIFVALSVLILINHANKHPYRLITPISKQAHKVDILGGIYVDKVSKKYIEQLQKIKNKYAKNEQIYLIDMTGGSPGANVILEAGFFGQQWLSGGYKYSDKYVYRILKAYENTNKLKKSWILIAPYGRRKLDNSILQKIGLNFPGDYKKVIEIRTAHRKEVQELWIPINKLDMY